MRIPLTITVLIAIFSLFCYQASAQRTDIPIIVTRIDPNETETRTFYFSADVRATLDKDSALGEKEIPTIAPPLDIFYLWTVIRTTEEKWLSPLDIRKLRGGEKYVELYNLHAAWQGDTLRFGLQAGLPAYVDSVYIVDDYTDWPNNIVKFKLESGQRYSVTNPSIVNYVVRVYYDGTSVRVNDNELPQAKLLLSPNPVSAEMLTAHDVHADATTLDVLDVRGGLCASFDVSGGETKGLNISHLPAGAYVMVERHAHGTVRRSMFIRQ